MSSEHGLFTEEELRALVERDSRFSQRIAELEAALDLARRCSTCEGQAHASRLVCICGGSGLRDDEVLNLRVHTQKSESERNEAVAQVAALRGAMIRLRDNPDYRDMAEGNEAWNHAEAQRHAMVVLENPPQEAAALLREVESGRALREWLSKFDEHHQAEDFLGSQDLWTENLWFQSPNSEYVRLRDAYDAARAGEGK